MQVLQHRVLPVLLRLLADTRLRQDVPPVLSHLLELDGGLAVAAVDADVMHLLCQLLIFFEQWSDACLVGRYTCIKLLLYLAEPVLLAVTSHAVCHRK